MKSVTVREIYDAIKKNGFEHLRGAWIKNENHRSFSYFAGSDFVPKAGCPLGQAAINLNLKIPLMEASEQGTLLNALNFSQTRGKWFMADSGQLPTVAGQIMYWNDKIVSEEPVLKTYEEVVQMCYDVLSPHFDKVVQVEEYVWNVAK